MQLPLKQIVSAGMALAFDVAGEIVHPFTYKQFATPTYVASTGVLTPGLAQWSVNGLLLSFKQSEIDGEVVMRGDEKIIVRYDNSLVNGAWYYWDGTDNAHAINYLRAATLAEAAAMGTALTGNGGNDLVYATAQGLIDYLANVNDVGTPWFDLYQGYGPGGYIILASGQPPIGLGEPPLPMYATAEEAVAAANAANLGFTQIPLYSGTRLFLGGTIISENDFFVSADNVVRQVRSFSIDPTASRIIFHVRRYGQ